LNYALPWELTRPDTYKAVSKKFLLDEIWYVIVLREGYDEEYFLSAHSSLPIFIYEELESLPHSSFDFFKERISELFSRISIKETNEKFGVMG
jgi:hypothetical protein